MTLLSTLYDKHRKTPWYWLPKGQAYVFRGCRYHRFKVVKKLDDGCFQVRFFDGEQLTIRDTQVRI